MRFVSCRRVTMFAMRLLWRKLLYAVTCYMYEYEGLMIQVANRKYWCLICQSRDVVFMADFWMRDIPSFETSLFTHSRPRLHANVWASATATTLNTLSQFFQFSTSCLNRSNVWGWQGIAATSHEKENHRLLWWVGSCTPTSASNWFSHIAHGKTECQNTALDFLMSLQVMVHYMLLSC